MCTILSEAWCLFSKKAYSGTKVETLRYRPDFCIVQKFWEFCELQLKVSGDLYLYYRYYLLLASNSRQNFSVSFCNGKTGKKFFAFSFGFIFLPMVLCSFLTEIKEFLLKIRKCYTLSQKRNLGKELLTKCRTKSIIPTSPIKDFMSLNSMTLALEELFTLRTQTNLLNARITI